MPDKQYKLAKALKDSINQIESVVDGMIKSGAPEQFEYFEIIMRFSINILAMIVLVRLIYYTTHKNKDFLFTFFLFNILIFIICLLLGSTKIKMGFAFGLFAIFSIIRYRTVTVPIKEMGYFFTCVALGLVNALAETDNNFYVIIACNATVLLLTGFLDKYIGLKHENSKEIVYERIDLIQPEKRDEMIKDLRKRTGLPIHRVEVRNVNFLRDTANIYAYYYAGTNENRKDITSQNATN
jgi:hypothetical protein